MRARGWSFVALAVLAWVLLPAVGAAQARQGLLSLASGRLFYEVVGEGDPIVVVHGGPGLDHNYLRPGLDVLASSRALVYYDQRGTGRSGATLDSASIHLDAFVSDIDALRVALGYPRITVLGHSFGALIALAYALRHPDETRALVLLDPVEPGSRWATETARRAAAARTPADSAELAALVASPGYQNRDPATMSQIYRVAFRGTMRDPARVEEINLKLSRSTAQNGPEVARLLGTSLGKLDWWDRLGELRVPTLVVAGRHEPLPRAMVAALVDSIPNARLAELDAGHFPFVEDPAGLASAVAGFLAGVGR